MLQASSLQVDRRLGGVTRYYLGSHEGDLMRVPDEMLKCVAFMAYWSGQEFKLVGTAFFVGIPAEDTRTSRHYPYIVTARHVIERIESCSADRYVWVRLNFRETKEPERPWLRIDIDDWYFHPDNLTIDVAVHPFWDSQLDHLYFPIESFATDEVMRHWKVGIGEEVFITGLFGHHSGTGKKLPILRAGNIAAMPEEPVNTRLGFMDAFLIEVRSISGISGSPVFVNLAAIRRPDIGTLKIGEGGFYLLGLIHGHWNRLASQVDEIAIDEECAESAELLNVGIAIVVPATKILEVINHPELKEMRERNEAKIREESAATPDALDENEQGKAPFTKENFEEALKKSESP